MDGFTRQRTAVGVEASAEHKRLDPKEVGDLEVSSVLHDLLILGDSLAPPQLWGSLSSLLGTPTALTEPYWNWPCSYSAEKLTITPPTPAPSEPSQSARGPRASCFSPHSSQK